MYNSVKECVNVSNMFIGLKNILVWACLKGVTLYRRHSKRNQVIKNHYDDNYSAPFACRSFA